MRYAFHCDFYPDKEWFVTAALIYDKILFEEISILQVPGTATDWRESLDDEDTQPEVLYYEQLFREEVDFLGEAYHHIDEKKLYDNAEDGYYDFRSIVSILNTNVDVYGTVVEQAKPLLSYLPIFHSYLPVNPNSISTTQLIDFRAENGLRRLKFQNAAEALIKSFGEVSTEEEAHHVLRLVDQELREQNQKLKTIYRHTRIEAAARTVGTIGGPPALIKVMESVLGISCVEAAGFVASAALSVVPWLIAKEKADLAVNDSPWAYMWHINKLG